MKTGTKRNWRNKEMRPQANNAQYNMQGWDVGGGVKWEDSGREGVGGSFVPTYIRAGWNGMTIHILSNSIKKGLWLTVIRIRGTAETRRCDADAVRLQVITWNPPLTLCASYLPLPSPLTSYAPLFSDPSLIVTLVNLAHGIQGCPKIISFDKNYWHLNFQLVFFNLLFLCCFTRVHFLQHPLPKKCTPFFLPVINPRILFLLSSSSRFLPCLNKCANYSYRRILKPFC